MAKIDALTPEEESLIPIVRDEWTKIALATGPSNHEAAQAAISDAYRMAGLEPPRHWIWLDNPWEGCIAAWVLRKLRFDYADMRMHQMSRQTFTQVYSQVDSKIVRRVRGELFRLRHEVDAYLYGKLAEWRPMDVHIWDEVRDKICTMARDHMGVQAEGKTWAQVSYKIWARSPVESHEPIWAAHNLSKACDFAPFDFFQRMTHVKGLERMEPLMRAAQATGLWWPFEGACIVTERPVTLHRDEAGRLHSNTGPALAYLNNWTLHAWHGLRIPAWIIEDKRRITPDTIEAEENAELRRVMLEIFGFDRYIAARGAKLIAEDECLGLPRQLFEIDLMGEPVRVLRVVNGTIEADGYRRQFHLGVPLWCGDTPHEAVAWTYGRPSARYRENIRS